MTSKSVFGSQSTRGDSGTWTLPSWGPAIPQGLGIHRIWLAGRQGMTDRRSTVGRVLWSMPGGGWHHFCPHFVAHNSVMWLHLPARETGHRHLAGTQEEKERSSSALRDQLATFQVTQVGEDTTGSRIKNQVLFLKQNHVIPPQTHQMATECSQVGEDVGELKPCPLL